MNVIARIENKECIIKCLSKISKGLFLVALILLFTYAPASHTIAAQTCVPPPSNLVSWWPGDGNTDDIKGGNHGALQGGATFAPGKVGQAFSFDGIDDYVQVANEANFDFEGTSPITMDAWVKFSPKTSGNSLSHVIVAKQGDGGGIGYQMTAGHIGPEDVRLTLALVGQGGQNQILGITQLADENWHHVAAVSDGTGISGMKLYVDGNPEPVSVLFNTLGSENILNNLPLTIGARGTGDAAAKGLIDEVEIHNRALSANEIQAIFNADGAGKCTDNTCVPPPSNLVSWWPGDGNADDIQDGNHTTLLGEATFAPGVVGQAFSFDGIDDEIRVPDAANLDVQNAFTFDAWVNATEQGIRHTIVWRGDGVVDYGILTDYTGERYSCGIDIGPSEVNAVSTTPIMLGTFQHVACTYDGSLLRLYIDGNLEASASSPAASDINAPLYIGSPAIPGLIDEVEVFNRALSVSEIQAIFNAGGAGKCKPNVPPEVVADNDSVSRDEGQIATNTGTYSDANSGDNVNITASVGNVTKTETNSGTWDWSFSTTDGPTQSQMVTIFADDSNGGTAQTTFNLAVNNVAPTATFANTTGTVIAGESATLAFSNQFDPSAADITTGFLYSYDCTNDGIFEVTDHASSSFLCPYNNTGTFTARGRIKDKDGGFTDYTAEVMVISPNQPPQLTIDNPTVAVDEGQEATNSGTVNDPNGDPVTLNTSVGAVTNNNDGTWAWSFATSDGPVESQTVTVFANDGNGGIAQTSFELVVNNVAPTAIFANTSGTVNAGESATLAFSNQFDPSTADTAAGFLYSYDCTDDGTFEASDIAATSFDCSYPTSGNFTAKGLIKDKDGGLTPYTATVTVELNLVPFDIYLHGSGPNNNPPILFLDNSAPGAANAKFKDSSGVNFNNGNPWKDVGTWAANPSLSAGTLTTLNDLHVWLGLKNSDDQGTKFDLRAEVYKNGTLITSGETYCITGLTRNAAQAKEVATSFNSVSPTPFDGTSEVLSLKIQTRIGTDGAGSFCGGHSNAVGLRLYFDAANRPSRFNAGFGQ